MCEELNNYLLHAFALHYFTISACWEKLHPLSKQYKITKYRTESH